MFEHLRKKAQSILDTADLLPDVALSRFGFDERAKYMFEHVLAVISRVETDPNVDCRGEAVRRLRELGLDDFGYLFWTLPDPRFPKLSKLLPPMAEATAQRHWTGRSGIALLKPSVNFVRVMAYNYARLTSTAIGASTRILDFGCGYGRIARLMYYFADEPCVWGVDPWDKSIALCRAAGLGPNFVQSEYLPSTLPVGEQKFQLIYAYSVFTHLSEAVARNALATLRRYVSDDGMLTITIRPREYWDLTRYIPPADAAAFRARHQSHGFAFFPHSQGQEHNPKEGEVLYGDTSIALEWFGANCPDWRIASVDRSLNDRLQTYVNLMPR
jgi:SAM-dependent methyltransferase